VLSYHQFRAKLGMGDLHPGGAPATSTMLGWLSELGVKRVLEVGAGMGNTSARMVSMGWDVTAIEPDTVMFDKLKTRVGVLACYEEFMEHHRPVTMPYDAIICESVLFQMDIAQAFAKARELLKPGGYLAFVEAVWSDQVSEEQSRQLHESTQRLFGIPVGSRDPLTWLDWSAELGYAGFETIHAELLPRGSAGHPPSADPANSLLAVARDPRLAMWMARYRMRKHLAPMPAGAQESWIYLGKAPELALGTGAVRFAAESVSQL
jgi:SAM-dependent methyltransferase